MVVMVVNMVCFYHFCSLNVERALAFRFTESETTQTNHPIAHLVEHKCHASNKTFLTPL